MSNVNLLGRRGAPITGTASRATWCVGLVATVGMLAAALLAGCAPGGGMSSAATTGASNTGAGPAPVDQTTKQLHGVLHGGQSPIAGSVMALYAAGQPASEAATPLIGPSFGVHTDPNGNFQFPAFTCPSSTALIYVVAISGTANATAGNNPFIKLMAALGPCGSLPQSIVVNELTTIAAVYALNAFSNLNPSGIGLGGCLDCTPSVASDMTNLHGNSPAINNSFGTAALLANVENGGLGTFLPPAASCTPGATPGSPPVSAGEPVNCSAVQRLTALANSLAACVNSTDFTPCVTLCANINLNPAIGDTLLATVAIARNPGLLNIVNGTTTIANTAAIKTILTLPGKNLVFSPGLPAANPPTDWTIALNFTGGGLNEPNTIALDATGNAWITNFGGNSLTELSPTGTPLSALGITGGGLNQPAGIAIDLAGNVWVTNRGGSTVSSFNPSSNSFQMAAPGLGGLNAPSGIAIDAHGTVWVANENGTVTGLSNGQPLAGSPFSGGGLGVTTAAVAIDYAGDVWVTNEVPTHGAVAELLPSGAPVSPAGGFTGGGLSGSNCGISGANPLAIAVDADSHVWIANDGCSSVTELKAPDGSALSGSNGFTGAGLTDPVGLAIDGGGNVWVVNLNSSLSELSPAAVPMSPSTGFTGGLQLPVNGGLAIDASGDLWMTNFSAFNGVTVNSVTEFIGAAVPVVTPLVAQITPPSSNLTSIAVTPANPSVAAGSTQQFTATGTYANGTTANVTGIAAWNSTNALVAFMTNNAGQALGVSAGTTTISATLTQNGATATGYATLTVTAAATGALACYPAPANKGGGAQPWDNEAYCGNGTVNGNTYPTSASNPQYVFSGTVTFVTDASGAVLVTNGVPQCQYQVSGLIGGTGSPVITSSSCTGGVASGGALTLTDTGTNGLVFSGTFSSNGTTLSGGLFTVNDNPTFGPAPGTGQVQGTFSLVQQ